MVEPEAFYVSPEISKQTIVPNMHYLADRKLVEMMMGYKPPMFSAVRITPEGIDLVENRFEFDRQFPGRPGGGEGAESIPFLLERLVEEGDFVPVDGTARRQLLGDILYLREELNLPADRWRPNVVAALLDAAERAAGEHPPRSLHQLRSIVFDLLESRSVSEQSGGN